MLLRATLTLAAALALAAPAAASPGLVIPRLDCMVPDTAAHTLDVRFGYTSLSSTTESHPVVVNDNIFIGGSVSPDSGQPALFVPGTFHDVFRVTFDLADSPSYTWVLDGSFLTVQDDPAQYCPEVVSNAAPPAIAGRPLVGETLTAGRGTWTSNGTPVYSHRWQRCPAGGGACADIPGATAPTYVVERDDLGAAVRVVVTADSGGAAVSSASDQTAAIGERPALALAPAVTGDATPGSALAVVPGVWTGTPAPATATRWQRCRDGTCADV
ncbi:MAG TPA: hypothetical protein VNT55_12590, partial [Baekduia sp.]|nr:hypothetical protein [Baekduia sp.]